MEYTKLGKTGLFVSKICVGCMSFGTSKWVDWVLDEKESLELIKKAWELGINFFDTADAYSCGVSEKILGKAIKQLNIPRSQVVIATKCYFNAYDEEHFQIKANYSQEEESQITINQKGNSRKHIFDAVENSLARLQTDYIDIYQIHRWDYETPVEETMEALHDLVKMGKVRYIGASSMPAWIFQRANSVAEKNGWTKFVSMQNLYNLIYREEEREMIPYLIDQGIGMINYSPLAKGLLCGKPKGSTLRANTDDVRKSFGREAESDEKIIQVVKKIAEKRGVTPSQIALAWLYSKPFVTSPIVGFRKVKYIEEAVAALSIKLDDSEIAELEVPYQPREIFGHLINKNQY